MEIDFVLIRKEYQRFMRDVRAIPGKCQHALVIVSADKKNIRNK